MTPFITSFVDCSVTCLIPYRRYIMVYEIITGEKWDFTPSATHDTATSTASGTEGGTVMDTLAEALYKYFQSAHTEEEEA